jgi:HAD superfamily hydrolase (TIGR01509 family)
MAAPVASPLRVLLLDAGNTLVFLDHAAVADIVTSHGAVRTDGAAVDGETLRRVEGAAKRKYEQLMAAGYSHEDGWGLYLRALLVEAGVSEATAKDMIAPLRRAHDAFNLWRRVPPGTTEALQRARAIGMRVAVVSNSEGMLPALFRRVGLAESIERVIDSHDEGVRKPDPELFRRALAKLGVQASEAIYLGDIPGVDVVGANAAGIDAVLVDPFEFYPSFAGKRVASIVEWVDAHLGALVPKREHPRVPFHLAFPVKDIESTRRFYVDVMGCVVGREAERWIDFDFFGHQISAHVSTGVLAPEGPDGSAHGARTGGPGAGEPINQATNPVDGDDVPVRHFGAILPWDEFHALVDRLTREDTDFLIPPRTRFIGEVGEQATFFMRDPSGNALEVKSFRDPARIFAR